MVVPTGNVIARARCDANDRLVEAQEPLAGLQRRCGGAIPGPIAIPELRRLVHKARTFGFRISRAMRAFDGTDMIQAWVEILPLDDDEDEQGGCDILLSSWQATEVARESGSAKDRREVEIVRAVSDFTALLDPRQCVLTVESNAPDLQDFAARLGDAIGRSWIDFVTLPGLDHEQKLHWRILDGAACEIDGIARSFAVRLVPIGGRGAEPESFELHLVSDQLAFGGPSPGHEASDEAEPVAIGLRLAPALRQPVERILGDARAIRSRLAGPLAPEYSDYAADIGDAGRHLLALLDDLSDLALVEHEGFEIERSPIDLADATRKAATMLASEADARGIAIELIEPEGEVRAAGDYRRVVQILLNLIGNAIRYAPARSQVALQMQRGADGSSISVADEGEGLDRDQQKAVFEKFERLGRTGDGGSGLGLYISRRLARAMGGDVTVESTPGQGARFTLSLPPPE